MRRKLHGDNFATVADPETYLHRIGRTGRFGKKGTAITLIDSEEPWQQGQLRDIEKHWERPIEQIQSADDIVAQVPASV